MTSTVCVLQSYHLWHSLSSRKWKEISISELKRLGLTLQFPGVASISWLSLQPWSKISSLALIGHSSVLRCAHEGGKAIKSCVLSNPCVACSSSMPQCCAPDPCHQNPDHTLLLQRLQPSLPLSGMFCSLQNSHKFPVRIGVWHIWGSSVSLWQNMRGGGGLDGLWDTVCITVLHNIWHSSSWPRRQVATSRPHLRAIKQLNKNIPWNECVGKIKSRKLRIDFRFPVWKCPWLCK